jgi:hypothetical protein
MLKLSFAFAAAFIAAANVAHAACDNQAGDVIFEDTFSDDSGGWPFDKDTKVANDELTVHLEDPTTWWAFWNTTFNATDGDYCLEAVLPPSLSETNIAAMGLAFLGTDSDNFFLLQVGSNNAVTLWRKAGGKWKMIGEYPSDGMNLKQGDPTTLRVVVKEGRITPSVNGVDLRTVRAQVPEGLLQFGIYFQVAEDAPKPGADFIIKDYKVTAGG